MFGKGPQAELLVELERLRRRVAELEAEQTRGARLDTLTGLMRPRALRGRLAEEIARARRYQRPLSLGVLAIDDFAAIESQRGFKASDELVAAIAKRLRETLRSHDLVGRSGPAEFVIVLPETEAGNARTGLDRLLLETEALGEGIGRGVSASLRLAGLEPHLTPE